MILYNKKFQATFLYIGIAILLFIALFPLLWATICSFKPNSELFSDPFRLLPKKFSIQNYVNLFRGSDFIRYFLNSVFIASFSTIFALVLACLAGYSLTRFKFPGSKLLTKLMLDAYMIPPILLVLPIYLIIVKIGLRDSIFIYALIVMGNTLPFCLWLVNSYYSGISVDYEEAAMVDGATRFMAFYKVVIPQLIPAVVAVGIQAFVLAWNDLLFAQILISSDKNRTLALAISGMFAQDIVYPWGVILAATVVATLPVLIMFVFGVDKLIGGWSEGGIKG